MRLEFETSISANPHVANEAFEETDFGRPSDLDSILKRGIEAAQNGDRESARKLLSQASAIDPNSEDAWMWLASISEYPEELLAFLDRVLNINPDNSRAVEWRYATRSLLSKTFVQRATAAYEQGSLPLAERCVEQALEYDTGNSAAWFLKGEMSDNDDERLELFARVLEADPAHQEASTKIAAIHAARSQAAFEEAKQAALSGDHAKASEILEAYLDEEPRSVEAWILRSHLSIGVEQKIEALEKALEIDPENTAARSGLAFLALTFGASKEISAEAAETESDEHDPTVIEHDHDAVGFSTDPSGDVESELATSDTPDLTAAEYEAEPMPVRSAEEMFGTIEPIADPENETVERLDPFATIVASYNEPEFGVALGDHEPTANEVESSQPAEEPTLAAFDVLDAPTQATCPFCRSGLAEQAFECGSCRAPLSLSDLEALLNVTGSDREAIQTAVTQMEAEWNLREFNVEELTFLGIGHFSLGDLEAGLRYLQEASRLDPNDVILSGKVNAIAIRLDEIQRQNELHETQPTGKTILVVDDSPTVRKLISGKLEKSGHVVICASDGVEALERLEDLTPDLVLLDITMPRMDGYEVCKQIRSNPSAKDLPVVMISGKDGFFDKVRGRMAGSTGYVTKPFGPETLMKALETYLRPEA